MSTLTSTSIINDEQVEILVEVIESVKEPEPEPVKEPEPVSDLIITLLLDSFDKNLGSIVLSVSEKNILKEFISINPTSLNDINKCIEMLK